MTPSHPPAPSRFPRTETEQSLAARFESQARRHPDRVAVLCGGERVSYADLDHRASAVARAIAARLGPAAQPVAVLCGQTVALVVAIVAVLKAGQFYVPLDPSHPVERLRYVRADARAELIVTEQRHAALASALGAPGLCVDDVEALRPDVVVPGRGGPDTAAYIYYTSGSTGAPKGVLDTQRNVLHNVLRYTNALRITEDDRLTLLQRPAFSGAVSSLFGALLNGATSCLFDLDAEGVARLPGWIEEHGITLYHSVPAIFRGLAVGGRRYPTVRAVRLEGDLATPRDVEIFRRHFPAHAVLSHGLGATECGLVRRFELRASDPWHGGVVPIGYPVEDMDVVVVDDAGREVAPGEVGEIAVRSRYLALGYWERPALTAARFLDAAGPGARTYLTGDLGRMAPDGCLEHLGRKDFQLIVGGTRVEVEAVESALVASGHAREAAVTLRKAEDGRPRLVALVAPAGGEPSVGALRRAVAARVPRTSIPSDFLLVDALPVNDNGKVDRTALADVAGRRAPAGSDPVGPRDDVELVVTGLWEEHLGVRPVGVRDEFLDLGGDSLAAAAVLAAVEERFGRALEPSLLLDGGTVERMARAIAQRDPPASSAIVTVQRGGALRPLFYAHGDVLGGAAYCAALARALGSARPFHAVVPHGTRGGDVPSSLEAMAAERLRAVLDLDPRGPYLIGGHCMMGGLLAFEMACQLEAAGRSVDVVIVVDTAPPGSRAGLGAAERGLLRALEAGPLLRLNPARRIRLLLGCRRVAQAVLRRAGLRAPALRARDELVIAYRRATLGYRPGRLRARLVLLWPDEAPVMPAAAAVRAWSELASTVVLSPVPGTHATTVTRHLDTFARVLARALPS